MKAIRKQENKINNILVIVISGLFNLNDYKIITVSMSTKIFEYVSAT